MPPIQQGKRRTFDDKHKLAVILCQRLYQKQGMRGPGTKAMDLCGIAPGPLARWNTEWGSRSTTDLMNVFNTPTEDSSPDIQAPPTTYQDIPSEGATNIPEQGESDGDHPTEIEDHVPLESSDAEPAASTRSDNTPSHGSETDGQIAELTRVITSLQSAVSSLQRQIAENTSTTTAQTTYGARHGIQTMIEGSRGSIVITISVPVDAEQSS